MISWKIPDLTGIEWNSPVLGILGCVMIILWSLHFFYIFGRTHITVPGRFRKITVRHIVRFLSFIMGVSGLVLVSVSLAGPRRALKISENPVEVNDIFFVLDTSRSMEANDFHPNRLEAAKQKMVEFVKMMPKDRIGVVAFGERVFTVLPLTTDMELVKKVIPQISLGMLGGGTNIGDAIGLAVARAASSLAYKKILILLTDGVPNVGNMTPIDAAEEARKVGIKIYSIGMGANKDAQIPLPGGGYQPIPGGSIDTQLLQQISSTTGGKMYLASDHMALGRIFEDIERLEKKKIKVRTHILYEELFFPFLLLGSVLFLLSDLIRRFLAREVA